jgi:hypothetical protein
VHAIAAHDRQEETRIVDALCTALLYGPAPTPHAIARCRELLEPATRGSMREAVILSSLAGLEAMRGDITDARNDYQRAGTTFAELELPYFVGSLAVISGPIELAAGDAEGAERMLRLGIELLADRGTPDKIAIRSAFLALALLAQGRRDDAARALDSAVPEGRMPRIAHALAAGRVHDDVSAAREAVALAAETQALNLHADARASLADLLETAGGVEALEQRRLALELYERKGNELAARSLRLVVARV